VKPALKYTLELIILSFILAGTGILLDSLIHLNIKPLDIIWITMLFSFASFIAITIFFTGQNKEIKSQPVYTLAANTVKFLIELGIALIWFIVAKKISLSSILLFFVLYLTFSMFSIWVILNTLKNKSL
jgi:hypothetical protein